MAKKNKSVLYRFTSKFQSYNSVCKADRTIYVDGRPIAKPGFSAQFISGFYSTNSEKHAQMLRDHPRYGYDFYEVTDNGADVVDGPHTKKKKKKKED